MGAKTTMPVPPAVANDMSYSHVQTDVSVSSLHPIEVSNRRSQASGFPLVRLRAVAVTIGYPGRRD